jgi:hypothetical protein
MDKEFENNERQTKIEKLQKKSNKLSLKLDATTKKDKLEDLKSKIAIYREEIAMYEDEVMTEQKLWGFAYDMGNEGDQGNTFGKEVLKEGTMEGLLKTPYRQYPIF